MKKNMTEINLKPLTVRPKYHFTPMKGWMNDPNGFSFFNGKYHLFYQSNPNDLVWGKIEWGHAVSDNLVDWEHKETAIKPNNTYDSFGCWSGTGISKNDQLYLFYTGVEKINNVDVQTQNLVIGNTKLKFEKYSLNPIIKLPEEKEFRDPFVYKVDNHYICLVGAKGKIIKFRSLDLLNWVQDGIFYHEPNNYMIECPAYLKIDGQSIVFASIQEAKAIGEKFNNISSSVYMIGEEIRGKFTSDRVEEIDYGFDFYAPIFLQKDGITIMIAWFSMWGRNHFTKDYIGMMTMPREVTIKDNKLFQNPIKEITKRLINIDELQIKENYEMNKIDDSGMLSIMHLHSVGNDLSIEIFKTNRKSLNISYSHKTKQFKVERKDLDFDFGGNPNEVTTKNQYRTKTFDIDILENIDIYYDHHAVEIFVNKGSLSFSIIMRREQNEIVVLKTNQDIVLKKYKYSGGN